MPFGIIDTELNDGGQIPGTEMLIGGSRAGGVETAVDDGHLQVEKITYRASQGVETILVPQPSKTDLNDPLLWPRWQKEAAFFVIFVNAIVFAILAGPVIAPATFALAPILGVTLTEVAELSGYQLLLVAALGPLVSVLAQKYGKRPQFLFAAVTGTLGTIICIVGSQQGSYHVLLAGRLVQGLGVTAWESLSLAAVGDMFYLHERGWRTALIVCSLACMASMVSIISGVLFENKGYEKLFVAELPFNIVGLLATVFLLPETQYARTAAAAVAAAPRSAQDTAQEPPQKGANETTEKTWDHHAETVPARLDAKIPKRSYIQTLAPWGRTGSSSYTTKTIPHLLSEIFVHLINPAVFWILMVSAVLVAFFVVSAYILSQIWSVPPYDLNVAQNGYFWAGAFVGGVLAVFVGPLCDWSASTLARANGGVYEAEFRIPVNILGALFCSLGWFLFMWVVENPRPDGYFLGAFFHGCACFGISVPSTSAGLYILQSTEVFVLQMMLKNFLFYAFSTFINTWAAEAGGGEVFQVFGIVSLVLIALCIPMYVFGKLNRKLIMQHTGVHI
ncbi:major facilitator superfamily transporter [Diaporthe helianthi]|uniref:Major facilitator superfamily transporter n=1 Tax=Diaporthe helianthi TaxID=158607 RepID=A0A2P5HLD0_DIAHE|nr:major facilitator superfamily transporter [Diaporthe helianthi]